jgi:hypothetical protein
MKQASSLSETLIPWAGLVVGVLAAGFVHQFGSEGTFDKCGTIAPGPLLVVASIGLLACASAGLVSWKALRGSKDLARKVVATISVGCAAVFSLAILLPMIASMVLPPCFQ